MASLPIQQMSLVDAALEYAKRGKPVFPCDSANKRPLVSNGFKDASFDPIRIRAWWARWPQAMIGMPTGRVTSVWVLDVDDVAAFEAACDIAIPTTAKVVTGKGYHLYFVWDDETPVSNAQQKVVNGQKVWPFAALPGAEVRGEGGYIILPPSWHPSGRQYNWAPEQEPCEPPAELLDIVTKRVEAAAPPKVAPAIQASAGGNTPYGMKALQEECASILTAPMGTQESTLNTAALKIGGLVAGGALDHQFAASRLVSAGMMMPSHNERDPWTAQKIAAKVEGAMRDGQANPRPVPAGDLRARGDNSGRATPTPTPPPSAPTPSVTATPYIFRDPSTIPPRPWLYGRWMLRASTTAMIAAGGIGKTTFVSGTALALVTGRMLHGKTIWGGPKRVWIWNLEDSGDELARSIQAACKNFMVTADEIGDRLFVDAALDGAGLCVATAIGNEVKIIEPVVEALIAELKARKMDVLIIDPFVSCHEVDENSNSHIDKVAKMWSRVAMAADVAIILVHHTSKAGSAEVTAMSGRGAVAMINACRSALVFNRMTKEEAAKFGIDQAEHWRFFSVHDDKHNRAPAEKAEWFNLASVDLENGIDDDRPSDSLGVAQPWSPPDAFEGVTTDHLRQVQAVVGAGEYKAHHAADNWVGGAIASVFKLDATDKAHRARIMQMLNLWEANGVLKIEERKDKNRQWKKFMVVGRAVDDHSATPSQGIAAHGVAVEHQSATLYPAPRRGGCIAGDAAVGVEVSQEAGVAAHRFPAGNPAFRPIDEDDPAADAYDAPRTRF